MNNKYINFLAEYTLLKYIVYTLEIYDIYIEKKMPYIAEKRFLYSFIIYIDIALLYALLK